jgi:glyoxylate/hydroxypyruvate reductase A
VSIALLMTDRDLSRWQQQFQQLLPTTKIQCWPTIDEPESVEFSVAWKHPQGIWTQFPQLQVVSSLGAGCEHLVFDQTLPSHVQITRVVDDDLTEQMAEYILTSLLMIKRQFLGYIQQQQHKEWHYIKPQKITNVMILGYGQLGMAVATKLQQLNFSVLAYAKHQREHDGISVITDKRQLIEELKHVNAVINLLPLTQETTHLIDAMFLQAMQSTAWLINVGRGATIDEAALIHALQQNVIAGAVLDVFQQEPLSSSHPFWTMDNVIITPHIAAISKPKKIIELLVENYSRMKSGKPLLFQVDRTLAY